MAPAAGRVTTATMRLMMNRWVGCYPSSARLAVAGDIAECREPFGLGEPCFFLTTEKS
jgi:hypothetical protein